MAATQYELYRRSSLGNSLIEALDVLHTNDLMSPQMAMKVLSQFDTCIAESLQQVRSKATMKGSKLTYGYCDDVWTFIARDVTVRIDQESFNADKIKIVACSAKSGTS
ncbi:transcription initiation factor IIA, gamma subunit-domain-containing protein [Cladochytrium replicatum]|nr:transcription initiation factor IIA, gamma subunit-domain-containing protein [Cladochytrium replicatum]